VEYDCFTEAPNNPNILDLHFKIDNVMFTNEDATKKTCRPSPSLNTIFRQIFGEALVPLGFIKIKNKHPYFIRLIGDEILHIVTYTNPDKHFDIRGGVATVFRKRLSLDESPSYNINWLKGIIDFFNKSTPIDDNPKYSSDDLREFYYSEETKYNLYGEIIQMPNFHGTIIDVVEHTSKLTEEIIVPILNKVIDIDSCIEYFHKFGLLMHIYDDVEDFFNKDDYNFYNEGLLYIKSGNRDLFIKSIELSIETQLARTTCSIEKGRSRFEQAYIEYHEKEIMNFENERPQRIARYNEIFDRLFKNSGWYTKALSELERRKAANIEILRSYGLNI